MRIKYVTWVTVAASSSWPVQPNVMKSKFIYSCVARQRYDFSLLFPVNTAYMNYFHYAAAVVEIA